MVRALGYGRALEEAGWMVGGWLSKALILADLVGRIANAVALKQLVRHTLRYTPVERKDSSIM